ncbi:unnamed protein product [Phytophthora lilii]|uniref:Unnamed protein product n=1 Tax=Phytophthora lilii TaxID=2077276 RepID=A0A9W6U7M9_9STRA|nr:unnamed protein product [Phytophthora lilii]
MENVGVDEWREPGAPVCSSGDQLFNIVYDPRFDRFFLEDEALNRDRSRTCDRKAISIPWEKWILPPKSPPKRDQQDDTKPTESQQLDSSPQVPEVAASNTPAGNPVQPDVISCSNPSTNTTSQGNQETPIVPTLDFSSFQQPLAEVSVQKPTSAFAPVAPDKPKKSRVQDYTVHFKRTNQDVAKIIAEGLANAEPNEDHEVKWNGEVLRMQVPGLRPHLSINEPSDDTENEACDALQLELLHGSTEQWPGSTYELKNLMRIRAHADGLRGVNTACRFVEVSSSESSDSEQEVEMPPKQESEEEADLMPVFFRDDRVLFHAKRRWFKGTVRRRIPRSDFYNIRADNGSLFEAVLASKIELLDEPIEQPYYNYVRGDKVLWIPDIKEPTADRNTHATTKSSRRHQHSKNDDDELTYKAKIVQVRSLNRFDLLLRAGRTVKKVPYEQLRPRDASEFVSTTTRRHR